MAQSDSVSVASADVLSFCECYTAEVYGRVSGKVSVAVGDLSWTANMAAGNDAEVACWMSGLSGPLARFRIGPMPNSGSYCVSSDSHVHHLFRRMGIGHCLQPLKAKVARLLGFGTMLCTCNDRNVAQVSILTKGGWSMVSVQGGTSLWQKRAEEPKGGV